VGEGEIMKSDQNNLLSLSFKKYQGPELELRDGTRIQPGDTVGELRLANKALFRIQQKCSNRVKAAMCIKKEMRQNFESLAKLVVQQKEAEEVKAFYGITIFHQGARLLGLEVKEIEPAFKRLLLTLTHNLFLFLCSLSSITRTKSRYHLLVPKVIWISKEALLQNFLPVPNHVPAW